MAERVPPLSVDDLCAVQKELYDARPHWYNLGLELGLKPGALDAIKSRCSGDECFRETLKEYLKTTTPSWRALVEALRSPTVGQPKLAETVEQKYCPALKLLGEVSLCRSAHPSYPSTSTTFTFPEGSFAGSRSTDDGLSPEYVRKYCSSCGHPIQPDYSPGGSSRSLMESSSIASNVTDEDELHSHASGSLTMDEKQQPRDYGCGCGKCSFQSVLTIGCPKPVLSMSSFRYLKVDGLSEFDKQCLRGRLHDEHKKISMAFAALVGRTIKSLMTTQNVSVADLFRILMGLKAFQPVATVPKKPLLESRLEELKKAETIDDIFLILQEYMSFYSHHILEHIIEELGSREDQERLEVYKTKLNDYCKRGIFECPSFSTLQRDQVRLVFKFEVEDDFLANCTILHLDIFRSRIADIIKVSKYPLQLVTVEEGCLQLTYSIPQCIKKTVFALLASTIKEFLAIRVIRISCENFEIISNEQQSRLLEGSEASGADCTVTRELVKFTIPPLPAEKQTLPRSVLKRSKCTERGSGPSKMQPPDETKFEKEIGVITQEIKEKEAKLKLVLRSPSQQDISSQLAHITGELAGIEEMKVSNTAEVRRIEDQLKKLGTDIIRMEVHILPAGLRHQSEARIDDVVGKLEQQLQMKQFSATEERKLQLEIDALKKSKERLKEYQETKEQFKKMRNEQDQLLKRRDSVYRSTRDLQGHESELKDQQAELKKGLEEKREKHREFKVQKDLLSEARSSGHSTVADKPGEFLPRKTGEQEGMLFPPSSGWRRSRKERKRNAPTSKAPKRLNYNAAIFGQFSFLGISAPTTQPEIEVTLTQLQETLALYESKSVSKSTPASGDSGICVDVSEHELTRQEDVILDTISLSRRLRPRPQRMSINVTPKLISSQEPLPSPPSPQMTFYKPPPSEVGDSVDSGFSSCYTQSVASDIDIVMMSSMHEPATGDAGFDSP